MQLSLSRPWVVREWRVPVRWYRRLTAFAAFCVWALIVLGGMVRVTDSGRGCGGSWPLCQGHLFPSLEYHQMVEWNHRLFATLVGMLMIVTVGSTLLWYHKSRKLAVLAIAAAVTYLGQAILGGITVMLHLDHTWVAAHMGNSMLLLASVTLLALFARLPASSGAPATGGLSLHRQACPERAEALSLRRGAKIRQERQDFYGFELQSRWAHEDHRVYKSSRFTFHVLRFTLGLPRLISHFSFLTSEAKRHAWLRALAVATLVATYAAMLTGSAVVGDGADLACPSWPQCSGANLLPTNFDAWVNFGHRLTVGMSDVLMLVLTLMVWRFYSGQRRLRIAAHLLALLYVSQVFLGAFTIWLGAPEALRGAHLALAAATWSALVVLATLIWVGEKSDDRRSTTDDHWTKDERRKACPEPAEGTKENPQPATHNPQPATPFLIPNSTFRIYFSLIKPRVIPLLLVPTLASMLMAATQHPAERPLLSLILFTMLGGTLATGGAHAINQYLDRDIDARMRRTRQRPVVTRRIQPRHALAFGIALTVMAFLQLWLTVNLVAALLALAGNLFYVFVYTLWLKRTSVQNIVIGGAAGAVPPLVGWAAVTGGVDIPALLFFVIIFFWTPAHFWALALVRQEDYRAADVPMLPVVRGEAYTRTTILRYSVLLLVVSLLPIATRSLSWLYLAAALALGVVFVARAFQLARGASTARAWSLFTYSNIYLALLYAAMVADRLIALSWGPGA